MVKEHLLLREYSGKPWSQGSHVREYLEKLPIANVEDNFKETATRYLLPRKNIFTFGLQNGITERLVYFSCKMCRAFIKPHDVKQHMLSKHSKQDGTPTEIPQPTSTHMQPSTSKSKKNSHKSKKKIVPPPSVPPPPLFPKIDLPPPPAVSATSIDDLLPPVLQPVESVDLKLSSSHKSIEKVRDTSAPISSAANSVTNNTTAIANMHADHVATNATSNTTTTTTNSSPLPSKTIKTKKPHTSSTSQKGKERSSTRERSSSSREKSLTKEKSSSAKEKSSARERSSRSERSRSEKSSKSEKSSSSKSSSERERSSRRKRSKRSRNSNDYDPDKHCGVLDSSKRPCMRALTCANHTIIERRAVLGRSKNIDKLIFDYKASRVKNKPHALLPVTIAPKQCSSIKEVRNGLRVIELIYGNENSNTLGSSDLKCGNDRIMTAVLENLATVTQRSPKVIKPSAILLAPTTEFEQVTRLTKISAGTAFFKVSLSQSSPPLSGSKVAEVPSPTFYGAHPKPMALLTAPLHRVGSSLVLHQQAQRLERQRLDLQAVVNQHKQLKIVSQNKQISVFNSNHTRQSILKSNVKNNAKNNPLKRPSSDKPAVNDIKHVKVVTSDMNGFILNTDFTENNEMPPTTTAQDKIALMK